MTQIASSAFDLDSSLDLPADGYTIEAESSQDFREASDADRVVLEAGFIQGGTGTAYRIGHLKGGILEYEITITPRSISGRLAGRDNMAELIDRRYQRRYLLTQPTPEQRAEMANHTFGTEDPQPDPILYSVGTFRASDIAKDIATFCGLSLSWECRDYTMRADFDATGRPLDIIKKLVEPWSQVPMFAVDILAQDQTLICRPRVPALAAEYSYYVRDARVKQVVFRKRRAARYGKITLYGKLVPKGLGFGGGGVYQPSEVTETSTSEAKAQNGQVIQRVIRSTTYRMPEKIILRYREQTFDMQNGALKLLKDEQRENEWKPIWYNPQGPTSQPVQLRSLTNIAGIHPNDKTKTFRPLRKEEVIYSYESEGYQDMTTTRKWELDLKKKTLEEMERVTRTLKEASFLETEEVTTTEKRGKSGEFYVSNIETVKSSGLRPAGPKPGRTIMIGGGDTGPKEPLKLEARISAHVYAVDVDYPNPHMEQEDLDFILAQFAAASGLWENEVNVAYLAMPWLRKGQTIELTGLAAETGDIIPLGPALVTMLRLSYNEGGTSPAMLSTLRALSWTV